MRAVRIAAWLAAGALVLASLAGTGMRAAVAAQECGWYAVGEEGFSEDGTAGNSLFVYEGTPYVAFSDLGEGDACTAMIYRDGAWGLLGEKGFFGDSGAYASLVVYQGTPYLAYYGIDEVGDMGVQDTGASVWRCNMNAEQWEFLGGGFASEGDGYFTTLCVDQGVPYVAYKDMDADWKATVKRLDNAGMWAAVGGRGFSAGEARYTSLAMNRGTPYIAYADFARGGKATVMRYISALRCWVSVGNPGFSAGEADYVCLSISGGVPYVAYQDEGNGGRAVVMQYNANANRWEMTGGEPATEARAVDVGLVVYEGTPYVAYIDKPTEELRVNRLEGGQWMQVGDSVGRADSHDLCLSTSRDSSLFVYEGVPYVAYTDLDYGGRTTVKRFICPRVRVTHGANLIPSGGELNAPDTCVGTSTSAVLTIHNDGTDDLTVEEITLDGDDPLEFGVDQCGDPVIPAGGKETFTVRYAPRRTGDATALLNIWSDAAHESPYTVALSGTGTVPDINLKQGARNLPSRLSSFDYGNVWVGQWRDVVFTIENTGTAKLVLARWIVSDLGLNYRVTVPPSASILPGGRTNMTVRFAPRSVGGKKASISITSNDPNESPYVVGLTGAGT